MIHLYRMLHKPTGLYFTPSKGSGNLSKKGKVYVGTKPRKEWAANVRVCFYPHANRKSDKVLAEFFGIDTSRYKVDSYFKTSPEDWDIIQVQ